MKYEIGKRYFVGNVKEVTLNAIWHENEENWCVTTDDRGLRNVFKLSALTLIQRRIKRINLCLELTQGNELEVTFQNIQLNPETQRRFLQTSFDVMVENEKV